MRGKWEMAVLEGFFFLEFWLLWELQFVVFAVIGMGDFFLLFAIECAWVLVVVKRFRVDQSG